MENIIEKTQKYTAVLLKLNNTLASTEWNNVLPNNTSKEDAIKLFGGKDRLDALLEFLKIIKVDNDIYIDMTSVTYFNFTSVIDQLEMTQFFSNNDIYFDKHCELISDMCGKLEKTYDKVYYIDDNATDSFKLNKSNKIVFIGGSLSDQIKDGFNVYEEIKVKRKITKDYFFVDYIKEFIEDDNDNDGYNDMYKSEENIQIINECTKKYNIERQFIDLKKGDKGIGIADFKNILQIIAVSEKHAIVFDFDCTLTTTHFYNKVSTIVNEILNNHFAKNITLNSEYVCDFTMLIARFMLNDIKEDEFSVDFKESTLYKTSNIKQICIDTIFGGTERFEILRKFFDELKQNGELYISSRGNCDHILWLLKKVELSGYFKEINANDDSDDSRCTVTNKSNFIHGLRYKNIYYIDDDPFESFDLHDSDKIKITFFGGSIKSQINNAFDYKLNDVKLIQEKFKIYLKNHYKNMISENDEQSNSNDGKLYPYHFSNKLTYDIVSDINPTLFDKILESFINTLNVERVYIDLEKDSSGLTSEMINKISERIKNKNGGNRYKNKYLKYKNKYTKLKYSFTS